MEVHGFCQGADTLSWSPCLRVESLQGMVGEGYPANSEPSSLQFSMTMAQEKTDGWLTEAARLSTTLGLHSPVLQRCMHMLEEFRIYLPILSRLGSFQLQNLNFQVLLRGVFWIESEGRGREVQGD